jgi:predicted Fe-Mo cluster-binding NifX family protein
MKLCFPVSEDAGLESVVYEHFGSAPLFVIYDSEKKDVRAIQNSDAHHAHGMCHPLKALDGESVDAVILGGIGTGALTKLNAMGVKVLKADGKTIRDNVGLYDEGKLGEITTGCGMHGHGHGCG